jgi:phospholipid/cholesterol/gamma-HCH transport system substrate-binding protein
MGNKVINITPNSIPAPEMPDGGLLQTKKGAYTDEMIETLSSTNNNIEIISENLKIAAIQLNKDNALWSMLNDTTIAVNLSSSLVNIRQAAVEINAISGSIKGIVTDVQNGKGTAGALLHDTKMSNDLKQAINNINIATRSSILVIAQMDSLVTQINADVARGRGPVHALLKDSLMTVKINNSLSNIEKGTHAFNEDMEALKHNFLIRSYFRKEAKRNRKQQKDVH